MKRTTLAAVLMFLAPSTRLAAQLQLNLDGLASKAKESTEITLDSTTLQMASNFLGSRNKDHPEVKNLLASLKTIMVRTFEFANEGAYRLDDLQPIRAQLRGPGWSKIVGVDEKASGEMSEIYTKTDQGKIVGVAILNAAPKELSVVYIEGAIDLAALSNLGGNFGIPRIQIPNQKGKEKE
jgi:Domain of unknown function (DUF4252)